MLITAEQQNKIVETLNKLLNDSGLEGEVTNFTAIYKVDQDGVKFADVMFEFPTDKGDIHQITLSMSDLDDLDISLDDLYTMSSNKEESTEDEEANKGDESESEGSSNKESEKLMEDDNNAMSDGLSERAKEEVAEIVTAILDTKFEEMRTSYEADKTDSEGMGDQSKSSEEDQNSDISSNEEADTKEPKEENSEKSEDKSKKSESSEKAILNFGQGSQTSFKFNM